MVKDYTTAFWPGAQRIFEHQKNLNKINVFPVQDGDTGTNIASTMRAIIDTYIPTTNLKQTADAIADAALVGARGNSGIIFAQFVYGFSDILKDERKEITVSDFSVALKNAVTYSYEAISNPVEGTMITVMREWAESVDKLKDRFDDFNILISESLNSAKKSLEQTPKKLEVLAKAKVVDAGGKAFVHFLEGMTDFFKHGEIRAILSARNVVKVQEVNEGISHEEVNFRYCTECLLVMDESRKELKDILRNQLDSYGDSLVIAGSPKKLRMHIHTDNPSQVFTYLEPYGNITFQKVDDMVMQKEMVNNPKLPIGIISDSACDIPSELVDKYQIHIVPLKIHFGEQFFLDGLTLKPKELYKKLDSSPIYPNSAQPSYHDFLNKYDYLATHFDAILGIHISKNMSGVWSNSKKAGTTIAQQQNKNISVVDSKRLASGQGLLVLRAAQAAKDGMSKDEIVEKMEEWIPKTKQYVSVKTLKYMVKSGRVSPVTGAIGKLFNLKPVVTVNDDGKSESFGKPLTEKGSIKLLMKAAKKQIDENEIWGYAISHANNRSTAEYYAREIEKLTGLKPLYISDAPPALALNAGPGVVALSIMLK
jgi:DegV family protein with EDD domain